MAGISAISGSSSSYYSQIASGKRINSAADDASGLSISEKLKSESGAAKANQSNDVEAKSALNIADGALSGVTDYLQRIKELSTKASNGLLSKSDKQAIQSEISQYLDGIDQIASSTQYNTKNLLDGSGSFNVASSPDGSGQTVSIASSAVEALGLKGYDVTGDFDSSIVDKALEAVSKNRSSVGAQTNGIEAAYNYSVNSEYELTGADSRLEDLDIPAAIAKQKQEQVMEQYRIMMQKDEQENQSVVSKLLPN